MVSGQISADLVEWLAADQKVSRLLSFLILLTILLMSFLGLLPTLISVAAWHIRFSTVLDISGWTMPGEKLFNLR